MNQPAQDHFHPPLIKKPCLHHQSGPVPKPIKKITGQDNCAM